MNVKNSSDLEEFPDGGRATLTRRYSPPLAKRQLDMLVFCPYDKPAIFQAEEYRRARILARLGLLEEDPQTRGRFRVTEAGAAVVHLWTTAGYLP